MRKIPITVYVDDAQIDDLRDFSGRTRIPMAAIIRRGIDMALAEIEERMEAEARGRLTGDDE